MSDDTYTHRPGAIDEDREDGEAPEDGGAVGADTAGTVADSAEPVERGREEWNLRDWVLIGVIVLCFLVIPATILVLPPVGPFRVAYLVLPLIPAFLLGAVAVWSAQRSV